MNTIHIQGIDVFYRELSDGEEVLYSEYEQSEQYFRRTSIPFTDDELVDIANKEHKYSADQLKWVEREKSRFEKGVYAYINGSITFIPGAYYCYVNYWTLEHGDKPEYRDDDRLFFLFHEYLRLETNALGLTRLKGRRQGATSIAMFFMWFVAGRKEHQLCGLTSFNDTAAQDAFQKMFMFGFKAMIPCFQADFDSSSENFIRFVKKVENKKKGVLAVKREGLNSYCDYKSNVINSYDSGRQSYNVPDEGGKRNKLNINSYWSRLYKTFLVGSNKVGFGYLPTTVGGKNEGGENYKIFYNNSNQFQIDKETGKTVGIDTINRVVRYFVPATHCYAGCIDKFGFSVIDDPETPVLSNEGKWITEGSRSIILRERARLEGEQLMEHRRDYPLDEYDAFAFESGQCEFDEKRLINQIEFLEQNPSVAYWRQVRFYEEKDEKGKKTIKWADDPKGDWWVKEFPEKENSYKSIGGLLEPMNTLTYSIGSDTFKTGFANEGSKGTICVTKKSLLENGKEVGMIPVAFFIGRPKLIKQFNEQMFFACLFYGAKINVEVDAGTWYYENFVEWGAVRFLEWEPARDPLKKESLIKPGTESAKPFQLAKQLEVAKMYFDGTRMDDYNGNIHRITFIPLLKQALEYNHSERTPYDIMIAFIMSLLPILNPRSPERVVHPPSRQVLPTWKVKVA